MGFLFLLGIGIGINLTLLPQVGIGQEVPTALRQEMSYHEARKLILNAGWQVEYRNPNGNRQLTGSLYRLVNNFGYNEFADCSGTGAGFCLASFFDAYGNKLAVVTARNEFDPILYRWWVEEEECNPPIKK